MATCIPLEKEMLPNRIAVQYAQGHLDFDRARKIADEKANEHFENPMLMAWIDSKTGKFSPNIVCCQESKPSWLVYAENRGGDLSIDINDMEYVFVYRRG